MRMRKGLFGAGAALAALLVAGPASAQITIAGSTVGCFSMSAALAGTCGGSLGSSVLGLTFTGTSFSTTSSSIDGTWGLGSNTDPTRNLGGFTLATSSGDYNDFFFHLFVTVTSPAGLTPSIYEFVADLSGSVDGSGAVHFGYTAVDNFPGTGLAAGTGTFPNGIFDISVANEDVTAGETEFQNGAGHVSTVPEPLSMLLFGSGLAGIIGARRRRKNQLADA